MVTIVMQADIMHESGLPESIPVAIEVGSTARVGLGVQDAGLVVKVSYGTLEGSGKQVVWKGKETFQGGYRGDDIEGYSVLMPMSEMLGGDKVVSVTTSNGGSWMLSGGKYKSAPSGVGSFEFPEVSVSDGFSRTGSELEDELTGGYQLG